ncbi:MAG TPA: amidophosphoribosyltransferase, partial [Acidobacteriota bacterium]|nr:amidophosphoribosyltransferase [Acidobacteriota bacterium]
MAGIFGSISKQGNCSESLYYGIDYHSHLGTDYAGMAVFGGRGIERKIHDIRGENFRPKFQQDYLRMQGRYGIAVIGYDIQPVVLSSRLGIFSIVINGNIENFDEIVSQLQAEGSTFAEIQPDSSISPAEVVARLITKADNFIAGIEHAFDQVRGSLSLLLLTGNGIYAARDRQGHSTLVVGESADGFAVTTETTAFPNLGFKFLLELMPGEIITANERGVEKRKNGDSRVSRPCAFLWVYTSFPATTIQGIN